MKAVYASRLAALIPCVNLWEVDHADIQHIPATTPSSVLCASSIAAKISCNCSAVTAILRTRVGRKLADSRG